MAIILIFGKNWNQNSRCYVYKAFPLIKNSDQYESWYIFFYIEIKFIYHKMHQFKV